MPATHSHNGYAAWVIALVAFIVVSLFVLHRLVVGYPRPTERYQVMGAGEVAFLRAVAATMFPAQGAVPVAGEDVDLPGYADRYLASLPARQKLLIRALFLLFEQSTIVLPARGVGAFRRFSSLTPEQRMSVLEGWAESRLYPRRMALTALKAVLTMGYVGDASCLRQLGLEPFEIESPVCEADLLYPPIGEPPSSIRYTRADVTPPSDGTPLMTVPMPRFADRGRPDALPLAAAREVPSER